MCPAVLARGIGNRVKTNIYGKRKEVGTVTESSGFTRRDFLGIVTATAALPVLGTAEVQATGPSGNPRSLAGSVVSETWVK